MTPVQIPFDIPHREAFEAEDYLVATSNEQAVKWVDHWPEWGDSHCTILYGPTGCGKTHLSHVWQYKSKATVLDLHDIDVSALENLPSCIIIEDIDRTMETAGLQEKLFHLYNWQKQKKGFLLLTARSHPKLWMLSLSDLSSRMLASLAVEIGPPDDDLLAAIIVKLFADRQITVPAEVISFLILRIERSFEAARAIVSQIDHLALSQKRKITVPLIRKLLE